MENKVPPIGVHVDISSESKVYPVTFVHAITAFFMHSGRVQIDRLSFPNGEFYYAE